MRKANLLQYSDFLPFSFSDRGRRPFSHAVHRKNCGFIERRWVKGAGCMGLVMFGKQNLATITQSGNLLPDRLSEIQFFAEPGRNNSRKSGEPEWRHREVGFKHPREFGDGLVVE